MQRGVTRARSTSDSDGDDVRPRQKQRQLTAAAATKHADSANSTSLINKISPSSSAITMGRSMDTSTSHNGNGNGTSAPGPSYGNGHSHVHIPTSAIRLDGALMYEDDKDWASYQPGDDTAIEVDESADRKKIRSVARGKRMPVNREEVVRLMLQGLRDIGYEQSASALEAESGFRLSDQPALDFESAILGGRWSEAIELLAQLGVPAVSSSSSAIPSSSSSSISSGKTKAVATGTGSNAEKARFLIAQQKYLEYLEVGQQKKALAVLRGELAQMTKDSDMLHSLSGFMMCLDKEDLYDRAAWDGARGASRRRLLEDLQTFISPQIMVPTRRLATLFDQARRYQRQFCLYHSDSPASSLYTDHQCSNGNFPNMTTHILADHTDEIWKIEWSPDGMLLASAGKDHRVAIWELKTIPGADGSDHYTVSPLHSLKMTEPEDVDAIAWSPDCKVLVIGTSKNLTLWRIKLCSMPMSQGGGTVQIPASHTDTIGAIVWRSDGKEFAVSCMDCSLAFYSPEGRCVRLWTLKTLQIGDFVYSPDNKHIVAAATSLRRTSVQNKLKPTMSTALPPSARDSRVDFEYGAMEHTLVTIRLSDKEIVGSSHDFGSSITCVKLSHDGKKVLVGCHNEVQLWQFDPNYRLIRKYNGARIERYMIYCSFGAPKNRFIISGSEDGNVYVWQSNSSTPIEVLQGHRGMVNAVAWNPVSTRRIFATCSDDATIRIWQPPVGGDAEAEAMDITAEYDERDAKEEDHQAQAHDDEQEAEDDDDGDEEDEEEDEGDDEGMTL